MHIDTDASSSGSSLSEAFSVAPMTPLFSLASQAASQLSDSSSGHAFASWGTLALDVSKRERGMLRATQDYKWTQTLAAGGDSSQAAESRMVFGTQAADTTTAAAAARAMAPPPPRRPRVGGRQTAVAAGGEGSQAAGAAVAVAGPLGTQQQQLARRRRQRGAQQQRKVVLYRTYRKGELPDIEIQLQDILRPLQHLALRDRQTARLLFEKLFGGIFSSSSSSNSSSSISSSVQKQLATALQSVLASAKHDTELVACLHAAYAEAVDATAAAAAGGGPAAAAAAAAAVPTLPPALVAESALRSLNCHSGALLLEQGLTRSAAVVAAAAAAAATGTGGASGGTTPRRASGGGRRTAAAAAQARADRAAGSAVVQDGSSSSSSSNDQDAWLQLSRLYFELGDADMLVGLIARTVRVARTREALEAELSGDINRAVRLYNELENEHYEGVAGSEASVAELVSSSVLLCMMVAYTQSHNHSILLYVMCAHWHAQHAAACLAQYTNANNRLKRQSSAIMSAHCSA
jgi:DNA-PKcs, CC5